jgi:predicted Zn-dependent protease
MNEDEQPRRLRLLLYGLVLALLVAGIWAARPAYRNWKKQRHLRQAATFLAQSDFRNAALSARQVLALDPANLPALRVMAGITEQLRSPELLACRQRIADLEPDNSTNQIALADAAMMFGELPRAERALLKVPGPARASAEFHQAAAMVLAAQNKLGEAEAHYAAALQLAPSNALLRINHAVVLLQARDTNVVAAGIQTLEQFIHDPTHRRMALENLAQAHLHRADYPKALQYARDLAASTNAPFADQMLLLAVLEQARDRERDAQLATLKTRAVAAGPEQVQALASWMAAEGQLEAATRWLSGLPADLQSQQRVSMALADLHVARADWAALQRLTESASWGDADFLRHALRARACREQNQAMSATGAWLEALRAAGGNDKMLSLLARTVSGWGWTREEAELLWLLVERHPGEHWAVPALSALYTRTGDTRGLNRLSAALLERNPDDVAARNNFAVTSLLLGLQGERAHELAREVYLKYPSNELCASTYAYSLFVQGKREDALKAFAAIPPAALEQPGVALYYGLILGTNAPAESARYLDLAAKGSLLPEEKALLGAARKEL